jgi:hypothetical protein
MTSRDAMKAIPPEKRCYYDAAALKKRVVRAARTRPRPQPTYLISPPNLPAPRMHLVFLEEQLAQENYQPILRPRLHEHFTDCELLANELWCIRTAAMMWRPVIDYMSALERTFYHQGFTELFPNGHEAFLQAATVEPWCSNIKIEADPVPPTVATQKVLNIP